MFCCFKKEMNDLQCDSCAKQAHYVIKVRKPHRCAICCCLSRSFAVFDAGVSQKQTESIMQIIKEGIK